MLPKIGATLSHYRISANLVLHDRSVSVTACTHKLTLQLLCFRTLQSHVQLERPSFTRGELWKTSKHLNSRPKHLRYAISIILGSLHCTSFYACAGGSKSHSKVPFHLGAAATCTVIVEIHSQLILLLFSILCVSAAISECSQSSEAYRYVSLSVWLSCRCFMHAPTKSIGIIISNTSGTMA